MTRKYHNHRLQTNPRHSKNRQPQHNLRKATSSLFLSKMIAKPERTPRTTPQNQGHNKKPHIEWEQQQTMNKQQQNHHPRIDSSI